MLADRGGGGSVARACGEYLCSGLGYFVKMPQFNGPELINSNIDSFTRQKASSTLHSTKMKRRHGEIWNAC